MRFTVALVSLAALVVGTVASPAAHGPLTINTPASSIIFSEPVQFTWSGGAPPYFLSLVAQGNTATLEVLAFGTTKTSFTWKVDLPAGTEFNAAIKDSTGLQQFTATLIVQEA